MTLKIEASVSSPVVLYRGIPSEIAAGPVRTFGKKLAGWLVGRARDRRAVLRTWGLGAGGKVQVALWIEGVGDLTGAILQDHMGVKVASSVLGGPIDWDLDRIRIDRV